MTNKKVFPSTRTDTLIAPVTSPPPEHYEPVDCDFTDDLEFASIYRIPVEITHWTSEATTTTTQGVIKDIVTQSDKQEFLILDNGVRIRLDRLQRLRIIAR